MSSDIDEVKIVEQAMRDYLYPIMVTVSSEAPLTGRDLERAWKAGYEFCGLRSLSDEQMEVLRNRLAEDWRRIMDGK